MIPKTHRPPLDVKKITKGSFRLNFFLVTRSGRSGFEGQYVNSFITGISLRRD